MELTLAQKLALKADIDTNPALAGLALTEASAVEIAAVYNATATPTYYVYNTALDVSTIVNNLGFDWTRVDNATVGEARIWSWLTESGVINAAMQNVRAAINEAWKGTAAAQVTHRNYIISTLYRQATKIEKLFATGTGTTVAPATMVFDGDVSSQDVQAAREL